jgi:hypothetical protein
VPTTADCRDVGEAAWFWVMGQLREDDGPWLPELVPGGTPPDGPEDPGGPGGPGGERDSLYAGIAGLAPVLAEISLSRALTGGETSLAHGIVDRLAVMAPDRTEASLYLGLAGDVTALRLLDPGRESVPLQRLAGLMTPAGWPSAPEVGFDPGTFVSDVVLGTAGVVLAAVWGGGEATAAIAAGGGEALLQVAEPAVAGLDWPMMPGSASSNPNYSHGTAGVAAALAVAGQALGRADFIAAAVQGVEYLLAVGSTGDGGFTVPHTLPPSGRDVEPVTYTWCHGPAGTSQLFAAMARAGVTEVAGHDVAGLRQRCLDSVLASGVPDRLRPGFWDNDGRCCGTAGVGEVLLDAAQDAGDPARAAVLLAAAHRMGDALVQRAIRDDAGARWRFTEHRQDPSLLPPNTSWMQGAAGIAAFLLRLARVSDDGLGAPAVGLPDQWWAVPAAVRAGAMRPGRAAS